MSILSSQSVIQFLEAGEAQQYLQKISSLINGFQGKNTKQRVLKESQSIKIEKGIIYK